MNDRGSELLPAALNERIVEARFDHEPLGIAGDEHYHARVRFARSTVWHSAFTFLADEAPLHETHLIGLTIDEARAR